MNFIPRGINSFRFCFSGTANLCDHKREVLLLPGSSTSYISQKILSATSYFVADFENKNYVPKTFKRFNAFSKNMDYSGLAPRRSLYKIRLGHIIENADTLPPGLLIATFEKLCITYDRNHGSRSFDYLMENFMRDKNFKIFCTLIEKNIPVLKPTELISLLRLVNFKFSPKSVLMRKIYTLILHNLHCLNYIDLIKLYCEVKHYHFTNVEECKLIINSCEEYFKTSFEDDLSHCENFEDISCFISNETLPLEVRKLMTEKCLGMDHYVMSGCLKFFAAAFNEPIASMYKTELLNKIKCVLSDYPVPKLTHTLTCFYQKGVNKTDVLYDPEFCDEIVEKIKSISYKKKALISIIKILCITGHFSQEAVDRVVEVILNRDLFSIDSATFFNILSIFTRVSFHEMNNPNWETIKDLLMSFDVMRHFRECPIELFQCCKFLTYLGCDTRNLIKNVFEQIQHDDVMMTGKECRSILRLYHLAKKYFPDENFEVKNLDRILQNSVYKKIIRKLSGLEEFFGGGTVLLNARTPDIKYLPFVIFIGENNCPVQIKSYQLSPSHVGFSKNFRAITDIKHLEQDCGSNTIVFLPYYDEQPFKYRNANLESGYLRMFLQCYENVGGSFVLLPPAYFDWKIDRKTQYLKSELNRILKNS